MLEYRSDVDWLKNPKRPRHTMFMEELLWVNCPSENPKCTNEAGEAIGYDLIFRKKSISLVPLSDKITDKRAVARSHELMRTMLAWKPVVQTGALLKINPKGLVQKRWFMIYGNELSWYVNRYDVRSRNDVNLDTMIKSEVPSKNTKASKFTNSGDFVFKKKTYPLVVIDDDMDSKRIFDYICAFWSIEDRKIVNDEPVCHIFIKPEIQNSVQSVAELGLVLEQSVPLKFKTDVPWHGQTKRFLQVKALPYLHEQGGEFVAGPAELAGLRPYDIIVQVNNTSEPSKVAEFASATRKSHKVELMVVRLPYHRNTTNSGWTRWRNVEFAMRQTDRAKEMWGILESKHKRTKSSKKKATFEDPEHSAIERYGSEDFELNAITAQVTLDVIKARPLPTGPRVLRDEPRSRVMSVYGAPPPNFSDDDETARPRISTIGESDEEEADDVETPLPPDTSDH